MSYKAIHGALERLALGLEDNRGEEKDWDVVIPLEDTDFNPGITYENRTAPTANIHSVQSSDVTEKQGEGSFTSMIYPDITGYILCMVTGQKPSTTEVDSSGVYEHEFTFAQKSQYQSATLHTFLDDDSDAYRNSVVTEWSLSIAGDALTQEVSVTSKNPKDSDSSKPERSDYDETDINNKLLSKHARVKVADDESGLSGADEAVFNTADVTVTTNAEAFRAMVDEDATDVYDIYTGRLEYQLQMNVLYNKEDFRPKYMEGDTVAVEVTIENKDVTLADDTTHPKIVLTYPHANIIEYSVDNGLESEVMVDVGFSPAVKGTDDPLKIKVVNSVESY